MRRRSRICARGQGYLLGGFGDYVIPDFLEANFTSCALQDSGCIEMGQYELEELGVGAEPPLEEEEGPDGFAVA